MPTITLNHQLWFASETQPQRMRDVEDVNDPAPILVTGTAGFIGFHVARALLARGLSVVGFDDLNAYYDPALKRARTQELESREAFRFVRGDLADVSAVKALFGTYGFTRVVHLAAQAGVRYSRENPEAYGRSNLTGFLNVLEACRHGGVEHLVYASSSSVYGANAKMPFAETDPADHQLSLYAATKKANEAMAHSYAHMFGLPCTGLRFFTVYGPWGRPDMAMWLFTEAILKGEPITLFNEGRMRRDFTYVDDVVEAIVRLIEKPAAPDPTWDPLKPDPATSRAPHRIYNIGNHSPVELSYLVELIEKAAGRKAIIRHAPMQPGDVEATYADASALGDAVGFSPSTPIEVGVPRFVEWYKARHGLASRQENR
jgi:UDP-glucuronate 4-epimerase